MQKDTLSETTPLPQVASQYTCHAGWYTTAANAAVDADGSCDPRLRDQMKHGGEGLCYLVGVNGKCSDQLLACPASWAEMPSHVPGHALVHKPVTHKNLCYSHRGIDYYTTSDQCPSNFYSHPIDQTPWLRDTTSTTKEHLECQPAATRCVMPDLSKPRLCKVRDDCANVTLEQVFDRLVLKTPHEPVKSVAEMLSTVHKDLGMLRLETIESDEDKFATPGFSSDNVQKARRKIRSISLSANTKSPSANFTGASCHNFSDPAVRSACDRLFDCVDGHCHANVQMGGEFPRVDIPRGQPAKAFCQEEFCREAQAHCPQDVCTLSDAGKCVVGKDVVASAKA